MPRVDPASVLTDQQPGQVAAGADVDTVLDGLALAEQAIEEADAAGIHMTKADVLALERDFIGRLKIGTLPIEVAERTYRILLAQEARLDRGELEDLHRRAALEEAYNLWKTSRPDVRSRTPDRPGGRVNAVENPAPSPAVCPPCAASVHNSGDISLMETAEEAGLRRAYEIAEAAKQARPPWAVYTAAPAQSGPRYLGGIRRRP